MPASPAATMWIAELWRYPVKSMAGERLESAVLDQHGLAGDRVIQVFDSNDRIITSRTRPALLGHRASLSASGEPLVDGRPWDSAEVAGDVSVAAGQGARLKRGGDTSRFDILPLLVATDGAIEAFGYDRRRLRPNIVIGGVPGLGERTWEGRRLRAGDALIGIQDLRQRCVMTTWDPDTLEQDINVLRRIRHLFGGAVALNARVLRGGLLRVGEAISLVDE